MAGTSPTRRGSFRGRIRDGRAQSLRQDPRHRYGRRDPVIPGPAHPPGSCGGEDADQRRPRRPAPRSVLPVGQLCLCARRHPDTSSGQWTGFHGTAERLGPTTARAVLERAVPSAERPARSVDEHGRHRPANARADPRGARRGGRAGRSYMGVRFRLSTGARRESLSVVRGWAAAALIVAAATVPGPGSAQSPAGDAVARAIEPPALRAHLEFLASDALEGRGTGTRGGDLAAKYVAAQFERIGLRP